MKNIVLLISGMPATGKTSFAKWLSSKMRVPLVCYDHIVEKTIGFAKERCENEEEERKIFRGFPDSFLMFMIEENMKSSCLFIIDFFFYNQMNDALKTLTDKYNYEAITVHMDTTIEKAHQRFHERGKNDMGMRPKEIPFEKFAKGAQQNKDFRFGDYLVYVDTEDFAMVSYEDIAVQVQKYMDEIVQ